MGEATRKQKRNRKEESIKLKITLPGVLLWIAKLLCIMLFSIAFLLVAKLILGYTKTITMSTEENVIDIGLVIIGLAISIWSGLNIVNSIERKELEELRARTDSVKKLINNLDNIESIAYDTFLQALLRMGNDEATAYFYIEFSKHEINSNVDFYTLTKIEDLFEQVYNLHNTVTHLDAELIQKAEEALEYIEGFCTEDRLVKTYLNYREAEFNYYCGYVRKCAKERYHYFSTAIKLYQIVLPKMNVTLPQYSEYKEPPAMPDDADKKLTIYMANTLGDASSKIIDLTAKISGVGIPEDDRTPIETMKKYGKMALFYCGCAAKWADGYNNNDIYAKDLHYFEAYYRNYGVACERYDRVFGKPFQHADVIIDNYLKAFYHIIKGTKISAQRTQSVYHALLSYLNRYFEHELNFIGNNGSLSPFEGKDALEAVCKYDYKVLDHQLEYLHKMVAISELAMVDMPRSNIPVVMNGFAYTYIILLKLAGNPAICDEFKEDCLVYLSKIDTANCRLRTMNIADDYAQKLKERYELLIAHLLQPAMI